MRKYDCEFKLNPKLSKSEVVEFEQCARVHLPDDYRRFLTEVGNGGFGPGEGGLFALPQPDEALSRPFPLEKQLLIDAEW